MQCQQKKFFLKALTSIRFHVFLWFYFTNIVHTFFTICLNPVQAAYLEFIIHLKILSEASWRACFTIVAGDMGGEVWENVAKVITHCASLIPQHDRSELAGNFCQSL